MSIVARLESVRDNIPTLGFFEPALSARIGVKPLVLGGFSLICHQSLWRPGFHRAVLQLVPCGRDCAIEASGLFCLVGGDWKPPG